MIEENKKPSIITKENPLKSETTIKRDDICYPEDFLIEGMAQINKKVNKQFIDLKDELAHPLSLNVITRNEAILEMSSLKGRIFKYYFNEESIKTIQLISWTSEETQFLDLAKDEILTENIEKRNLILMQVPVFMYLEPKIPEQKVLIDHIKNNKKYSTLLFDDEYIWPCFLMVDDNQEVSKVLLQKDKLNDDLQEIKIETVKGDNNIEGGLLIYLFGTNIYLYNENSNIISFEKVFSKLDESLQTKSDDFMGNFLKLASHYYKTTREKTMEVKPQNWKQWIYRLVYVEDTKALTKWFGIALNVKKNNNDEVFIFVRDLESGTPSWISLN